MEAKIDALSDLLSAVSLDDHVTLDFVRMLYEKEPEPLYSNDDGANSTFKEFYNHILIKFNLVESTLLSTESTIPINNDVRLKLEKCKFWKSLLPHDQFESLVLWSIAGKRIIENQIPQIVEDYVHFTKLISFYQILFYISKENKLTTVTFQKAFGSSSTQDLPTIFEEFMKNNSEGTDIPEWSFMEELRKKIASNSINSDFSFLLQIGRFYPMIQNTLLALLLKSSDNKCSVTEHFTKAMQTAAKNRKLDTNINCVKTRAKRPLDLD